MSSKGPPVDRFIEGSRLLDLEREFEDGERSARDFVAHLRERVGSEHRTWRCG